jgi:hypothetical protein
MFPPPPNALLPVPKMPPVGPEAVPPPLGAFPAPGPPNAEPLAVFEPRLPRALVPAAGVEPGSDVPWFLF